MDVRSLSSRWLGPISGILFVVVYFVGIGIGSPFQGDFETDPDEPAGITSLMLVDNRDEIRIGTLFASTGVFFLFWFGGYLHKQLKDDEGEDGWLATVALSGVIATAALLLVDLKLDLATGLISDYGDDTQVARSLAALAWTAGEMTGASMAALIGATSLIVVGSREHRSLQPWLGWIGLPLTLVVLVPDPGLRLAVFLLWVFLISLGMLWKVLTAPTEPLRIEEEDPEPDGLASLR